MHHLKSIGSPLLDVSYHFYILLDNYQCTGMSRSMPGMSEVHVYQKYGLYWHVCVWCQDVRSSFPYYDNYSQVSGMTGDK